MDLAASIKSAWAAVVDSGVPEHMQELAFREALRASLGTVTTRHRVDKQTPRLPGKEDEVADDSGDTDSTVDEGAVYATVAEETGITREKLERVFHVDGGVVKLIGPHGKYGTSTTDQARSVAQIVTVVRRLGMGHSDTSFDVIKDACESKHCYDSKNFASQHMPKIDGFVVKGEGRSRRLEAKGAGISAFPTLIDKVLGES